jgi:hypothetical protein
METLLSILLGIGLSAACGFRVFVPLLVVSVAGLSGHLSLAAEFQWLATWPALTAFALATTLEITAYYVPWLDNLLDAVASPAAVVAGTLITAAVITDMSPFLRWTLALIAGGGIAGLVQGTTVAARGVSTATTAGLANPLLATAELGGAVTTAITAIVMPLFLGAVLLALGFVLIRRLRSRTGSTRLAPDRGRGQSVLPV